MFQFRTPQIRISACATIDKAWHGSFSFRGHQKLKWEQAASRPADQQVAKGMAVLSARRYVLGVIGETQVHRRVLGSEGTA
jgi:hypothetical protein